MSAGGGAADRLECPEYNLTRASVLGALEVARTPLSIRGICGEIGYATRTPWGVAFLVEDLERAGLVAWAAKPTRRPWRVAITDAGRAALAATRAGRETEG